VIETITLPDNVSPYFFWMITNWTRLFFWRPSSVWFVETGRVDP
jgi:hypothetical protein